MNRKEQLMPAGVPRYVRVYDDGQSGDRYTVVFTGRYAHKTGGAHWYLGMSGAPFHPQGIGQHGEHEVCVDTIGGKWPPAVGRKDHLGRRIRFQDLPADCQRCAIDTYTYLWDLLSRETDPGC